VSDAEPRCLEFRDDPSGLLAFLVIDDTTLGPAAGGVRTWRYRSTEDAKADAERLARAMTLKCALGGLDAGGGKMVVMDHPGLDRARAFEFLGERVEELDGLFRTAGDLGTRGADLTAMARHTRYVHANERDLAASAARLVKGRGLPGLRVAVQGAGAIGAAAARELVARGAEVTIADVDPDKARAVGCAIADPAAVLFADVDVVAPCAVGGVIDRDVAKRLSAWCVCGAANNILVSDDTADVLLRSTVTHVPDVIASAGAVIDGIGRTLMGLRDRTPLIDRLGDTAREVLERAFAEGETPARMAERVARERIAARRGSA
jgi:leucine dehydrogenase